MNSFNMRRYELIGSLHFALIIVEMPDQRYLIMEACLVTRVHLTHKSTNSKQRTGLISLEARR